MTLSLAIGRKTTQNPMLALLSFTETRPGQVRPGGSTLGQTVRPVALFPRFCGDKFIKLFLIRHVTLPANKLERLFLACLFNLGLML
jgi:hypothetical protein